MNPAGSGLAQEAKPGLTGLALSDHVNQHRIGTHPDLKQAFDLAGAICGIM
jgi:hypothetical protein